MKDQNSRFSRQDTKMREIEKKLKAFNDVGGLESMVQMIKEMREGKDGRRKSATGAMQRDSSMGIGQQTAGGTNSPYNPELAGTMNMRGSMSNDKQVRHMQEVLADHGHRLDGLIEILDEKLDRNAIEVLVSDKVGKGELAELLPNMEAYDQKVESRIEECIDNMW